MSKFKFEDLQPHVDMLCDALENRGASASGSPYNEKVYQQADCYRNLISKIRSKEINEFDILMILSALKNETLSFAGKNQRYRITKILEALDIFIRKEYIKVNS
jgi:sialic acid synthase SpsE